MREILKLKSKRAFTVVELLVTIGLASLFTLFVFNLFFDSNASQNKATSDLSMQSKVLESQNKILRMIREGTDFILPEIGEESSSLIFADNEGNIQALYQIEDSKLSKNTGKKLYKLMHYKVEVKKFNMVNPSFNQTNSSVLAKNVKELNFLISNANTVNVSASFATRKSELQTIFEVALLNTGEAP